MEITTRKIGFEVEEAAKKYLLDKGLKFIKSNYECKLGEIDLIMQDKDTLVFVEVRFRSSQKYGGALASISASKRSKIIRTAKLYLLERDLYDKVFCRFDIITAEKKKGQLDIDWFKAAFSENFI